MKFQAILAGLVCLFGYASAHVWAQSTISVSDSKYTVHAKAPVGMHAAMITTVHGGQKDMSPVFAVTPGVPFTKTINLNQGTGEYTVGLFYAATRVSQKFSGTVLAIVNNQDPNAPAVPAAAASSPGLFSGPSVSDSQYSVTDKPPVGARNAIVVASLNGQDGEETHLEVHPGVPFTQKIFLGQGPGVYKISVLYAGASVAGKKMTYSGHEVAKVQNTDERDPKTINERPGTISDSNFTVTATPPVGVRFARILSRFLGPDGHKRELAVIQVKGGVPFHQTIRLLDGPGDYSIYITYGTAFFGKSSGVEYARVKNSDSSGIDYLYLAPSSGIQSEDPEIKALAAKITQGVDQDLDKALAIHEWVTSSVAYDTEDLRLKLHLPTDALSVLHRTPHMMSVCDGYANLYAALARAAGLRTKSVAGLAIILHDGETFKSVNPDDAAHAWNEVLIGKEWISIDTTWDAGATLGRRGAWRRNQTQKYFNHPAEFDADHLKQDDRD